MPQDRLRKFTEENLELANNLKKEIHQSQQQQKSTSKPGKSRRGPGSDGGSEDRNSSVPAGGRGTKRGRDNDIEKVGPKISIAHVKSHFAAENKNQKTMKVQTTGNAPTPPQVNEVSAVDDSDGSPVAKAQKETAHHLTRLEARDLSQQFPKQRDLHQLRKSIIPNSEEISDGDAVTRHVLQKRAQQMPRQSKRRKWQSHASKMPEDELINPNNDLLDSVSDILARSPPPDEPEYLSNATAKSKGDYICAPLIGGTTMDEKNAIEHELAAAGKLEVPEKYHPGYVKTKSEDPSNLNRLLFFECENPKRSLAIAGVAKVPISLDPPGSKGPFDALKFPDQLVKTLNQQPLEDLYGWDLKSLKKIPKELLEKVNIDALADMPQEIITRLSSTIHDKISYATTFPRDHLVDIKQKRIHQRPSSPQANFNPLQKSNTRGATAGSDRGTSYGKPLSSATNSVPPNPAEDTRKANVASKGCNSCQKHGLKCNGKRPRCFACVRFGEECSFSQETVIGDVHSPRSLRSTRSTSVASTDQSDNRQDVELRSKRTKFDSNSGKNTHNPGVDDASRPGSSNNHLLMITLDASPVEMVKFRPSGTEHLSPGLDSRIPSHLLPKQTFTNSPNVQKPISRTRSPEELFELPLLQIIGSPYSAEAVNKWTLAYPSLSQPQEETFHTRPSIRITIPDSLKNLLVDDWENVTKSLLLVPLPSKQPANLIIDSYFEEEKRNRRLGSAELDVLEEFCAGLKVYFEKSVGKILLYRFERSQYAEVSSENPTPLYDFRLLAEVALLMMSLSLRSGNYGRAASTLSGRAKDLEMPMEQNISHAC